MTLDEVEFLMSWYPGNTLKRCIFFFFLVNEKPGSVLWACVLGFTACNKLYSPTTIITY